ncbi:MAG: hypothetical protein DLM53_03180 [Candidatus Eremiobacter antarcticus]|nr:MAG: hypothetical protein DLM53_03180 [Candidatus Eremiobacter sp. RRmetagenome_bin22]
MGVAGLVAACGGGGGGGGGGTFNSPPTPTPTSTSALQGTMQVITSGTNPSDATYVPASNGTVVFTCGCTSQAGTGSTDASGNFSLLPNSVATPAAPNPTYTTVPGRNYLIVARSTAGGANTKEAWTMEFLGSVPARNHYLENPASSDAYTAAAALYVFDNSSSGTLFDNWDFNSIAAWVTHLHNAPTTSENTLLNHIVTETAAGHSLYPSAPNWNSAQTPNNVIKTDLTAVRVSGASLPVNCGHSPCGAQPTP